MLPQLCLAVMLAVCTTPGSVDDMCASGMAKGMPDVNLLAATALLLSDTNATPYSPASPRDLASGCLCPQAPEEVALRGLSPHQGRITKSAEAPGNRDEVARRTCSYEG